MKGKSDRNKPIFHYFDMDEMAPEDHILRLIDKYIDFSFIYQKVKHLYNYTGSASVNPEELIKMLFSTACERKEVKKTWTI